MGLPPHHPSLFTNIPHFLEFALLCCAGDAFLQIEGKTLCQQKDNDCLYCGGREASPRCLRDVPAEPSVRSPGGGSLVRLGPSLVGSEAIIVPELSSLLGGGEKLTSDSPSAPFPWGLC